MQMIDEKPEPLKIEASLHVQGCFCVLRERED